MRFNEFVQKDKSVLIIASRPLDPDCLGSGLILKKYLEYLGKKVTLIFPRKMEVEEKKFYNFVPYFEEIEDKDTREILKKQNFDLLILVDTADLTQIYDTTETKESPPNLKIYKKRIQIDHHQNSKKLGTFIIHQPKMSSTTEIILRKIIPQNFIDKEIANLGCLAIIGDTGNFQWNFSSGTLRLLALLMDKGAEPIKIVDRLLFTKPKIYFEMLGFILKNLEYFDEVKTYFIVFPYEKLQAENIDENRFKILKETFQDGINARIEGYSRGILICEKELGEIYVSGRGNNVTNTLNLVELFTKIGNRGGGHFNACSFEMNGDLEEIKQSVCNVIKEALQQKKAVSFL